MNVYNDDWQESGQAGMLQDFDIKEPEIAGAEILYATYTAANYEGTAFVLFRKDGKLYEVNGGHCSCYGLEGQWVPEETTLEALEKREFGYIPKERADEIRQILVALPAAA